MKPILAEKYGVNNIALFGSYSRDENTLESDIDILIRFKKPDYDSLYSSFSATAKMFVYPSPNRGKFNVVYYAPAPDTKYTLSIFDAKGARTYGRAYSLSTAYQQMNVDMRQNGKDVYRVVLSDKTGKTAAVGSVIIE